MKTLLAAVLAGLPGLAEACPVCARDGSPGTVLLVGALIAAPYAVAGVVIRAIRRGEQESAP